MCGSCFVLVVVFYIEFKTIQKFPINIVRKCSTIKEKQNKSHFFTAVREFLGI